MSRKDVRINRRSWDSGSAEYQAKHAQTLNRWRTLGWGTWDIPEDQEQALGDVRGARALELGTGAAQFGIKVAMREARVIGLDLSWQQLSAAPDNFRSSGIGFPLVQASAEELPFASETFDLVFCDHGATSFTDPHITIPEAARVLNPGGRLVFDIATPWIWVCWGPADDPLPRRELQRDYFGLGRDVVEDEGDTTIEWMLTYGDWIRLFRTCGLIVDDLIELRPGPDTRETTYNGYSSREWASAFPAENIWCLVKT